jgi:hypothetical protein
MSVVVVVVVVCSCSNRWRSLAPTPVPGYEDTDLSCYFGRRLVVCLFVCFIMAPLPPFRKVKRLGGGAWGCEWGKGRKPLARGEEVWGRVGRKGRRSERRRRKGPRCFVNDGALMEQWVSYLLNGKRKLS